MTVTPNKLQCWRDKPHLTHVWYVEDPSNNFDGSFSCEGIKTKVHKYTPDAGWCAVCGPDVPTNQQTTPVSIIHQTQWKDICIHCGVKMYYQGNEYDYGMEWSPSGQCPKAPWVFLGKAHKPQSIPVLPAPSSEWLKDLMNDVRAKKEKAAETGEAIVIHQKIPYRPKSRS